MFRNERIFNMLIILRQVLIKNLFSRLRVYSIQAFRRIFRLSEWRIWNTGTGMLPVCWRYTREAQNCNIALFTKPRR